MHKRLFLIIVNAIPIALIVFAVYDGFQTVHDWFVFRNSAVATGVVLSSEVHQRHSQHRVVFIPRTLFSYKVDGILYTNDVRGLTKECFLDCNAAKDMAGRYPEGKTIPVYYRKDKPQYSMLEIEQRFPYVSAGVDSMLLLIGCLFLLFVKSFLTRRENEK